MLALHGGACNANSVLRDVFFDIARNEGFMHFLTLLNYVEDVCDTPPHGEISCC